MLRRDRQLFTQISQLKDAALFAAALVSGAPVLDAVRFAVRYASESVRHPGTQTAFPRYLP